MGEIWKDIFVYLGAIAKAIWDAFEKTETIATIAIAVAAIWSWWSRGTSSELRLPGPIIAALVIGFVAYQLLKGMFLAYEKERRERERLQIRLTPQLEAGVPNVATTAMGEQRVPARYFRVPILNNSAGVARRCSARLLKVEFIDGDGSRPLPYNDTLQMAWSNKTAENAIVIDIHPSTVETLDIAFAFQGSRELHLATIIKPVAYEYLMQIAGQYQFSIQVTCEDRAPLNLQVRCQWGFGLETLALTGAPVTVG